MPLNLQTALVIGDSGGIGQAVSHRLGQMGVSVTGLSRRRDGFDLTDPDSIERSLAALDGPFDLILVATGILAPPGKGPEKSLAAIEAQAMAHTFAINTIGPALILRHVPRLLARDTPSVVGVLTARVGSIGDNRAGGWYSYRASKAAANQIVRSAAIEIARKRKQACVVALHPGTVETPFTAGYPAHEKHSSAEAAQHLVSVMAGLSPAQTGQFFDWAGQEVPW